MKYSFSIFCLVAFLSCTKIINPSTFSFGTETYTIQYLSNHNIQIMSVDQQDTLLFKHQNFDRHLSPCPLHKIILIDLNKDQQKDLCYYYCGQISIFLNQNTKLSNCSPLLSEYKEGHWTQIHQLELEKLNNIIKKIDTEI